MTTTWDDYLRPGSASDGFVGRHACCSAAYARQRALVGKLFDAQQPRVVACLGAGMMNDIPYRSFVRAGATVHLVDWLPGVLESGVGHAIISRDNDGAPACVYCALPDRSAGRYCRSFDSASPAKVCRNYRPAEARLPCCEAFEKGDLPRLHCQDVTGGLASAFGRAVVGELSEVRSWRQALGRAGSLLKRAKREVHPLDIADGSVDLVTSAMVISQFEHEPYGYFAARTTERVGPAEAGETKRLRPMMEGFRDQLLRTQIERHCDEIERIMAPEGLCFMSFELFHRGADGWFMVPQMHMALAILARRFRFNFDLIDEADAVLRFRGRGGASLVHCFVLQRAAAQGVRTQN